MCPKAKLIEEAERYAAMLIDKGPVALNLAKKAIRAAMSTDQESGMLIELLANSLLCGTKDKDEGLAAFFEKRTPQYKGSDKMAKLVTAREAVNHIPSNATLFINSLEVFVIQKC